MGPDKLEQLFGALDEGFEEGVEAGKDVAWVFGMELALTHKTSINGIKKEELKPGGALAGGVIIARGKGGGEPKGSPKGPEHGLDKHGLLGTSEGWWGNEANGYGD